MTKKINNAEHYGSSLGVTQREGEPELEFRKRVARAILDEYDDPLLATEIIVGKEDYHDFNDEENSLSYIVSLLHSQEKEVEFRKSKDTYFRISWIDFNDVLRHNGFERVLSYAFEAKGHDAAEEYAIWADHNRGILLSAESYCGLQGRVLNDAYIDLEIATPAKLEGLDELEQRVLYRWGLSYCSYSVARGKERAGKDKSPKPDTFFIHRDVREGLVQYLEGIDALKGYGFTTNNPWKHIDEKFLWLVDYSESEKKGYNYKTATQAKVDALPEKTRKMMGLGID